MVVISPLFAVFEVVQLFVAQRYVGIEQIRRGAHPLDVVAAPTPWFSGLWLVCLGLDYLYQGGLLLMPEVGVKFAAVLMLMVLLLADARELLVTSLAMAPYFLLYGRDLSRIGYRFRDLFAVCSLNLMLLPVSLAGVLASIVQTWNGRKAAFAAMGRISTN